MCNLKTLAFTAMVSGLCVSVVPAQIDMFLTGEVTDPNWSPGEADEFGDGGGLTENQGLSSEDYRFVDDGSGNDAAADDGILTLTLNTADMGLTTDNGFTIGNLLNYKAAGTQFSPDPLGGNAKFVIPPEGTDVIWTLVTVPQNDGFIPDPVDNTLESGYIFYNGLADYVSTQTSVQVTGSFQDELDSNTSDFDPAASSAITLVDDGTGADETADDDLYTGTVSNLPTGSYEFKVTMNGTFDDGDFGNAGFGGNNQLFNVVFENDTHTFTFDATEGRVKVVSDQEDSIPTNGIYAVSGDGAFQTAFDDTRRLAPNSDDNNAGSPYLAQIITVPTAGTYSVGLWDTTDGEKVGRDIPQTGPYPFTTTSDNQDVLIVLEQRAYTDGYEPASDFVLVLDAATREPLNSWDKVQPVGSFMDELSATLSDWTTDAGALDLVDDGGASDITAAGDGIYSNSFSFANGDATAAQVKAVGQRTGEGDTGFTVQFGGPTDGLTVNGNNEAFEFDFTDGTEYTFGVDTVNGRMAVAETAAKALSAPDRSAEYFDDTVTVNTDPTTTVQDWTLY